MHALFVGLCLTGCSALRPTVELADPQIVRVPGATRYTPVPPELTEPTPEPRPPVPLCLDPYQAPVLCLWQLVIWQGGFRSSLQQCNADKAAIATLTAETAAGG